MALSAQHHAFLVAVAAACQANGSDGVFTVVSEWLGYLPFGAYIWIEIGNVSVDQAVFREPWDSADIALLIADGYLLQLERLVLSEDGLDTRTTCRLTPAALDATPIVD